MGDQSRIYAFSKINASFSGGESSAVMVRRLKDRFHNSHEIVTTFANTGEEDERTLVFADKWDREYGLDLVWLEAVVHHGEERGSTHRVVTFETASRDGEPFEEMIKKYGIPNANYPHCTRELKTNPIRSYLRSIGWNSGDYLSAVGIRSDEIDRIAPNYKERNLLYPLADDGMSKGHVKTDCAKQPFQLGLQEHEGNCRWCWKKSKRKLLTLASDNPTIFEFPNRMEVTYPHAGAGIGPRVFFRGAESTQDILRQSQQPFVRFTPGYFQLEMFDPAMDEQGSCGDTCEIGADAP